MFLKNRGYQAKPLTKKNVRTFRNATIESLAKAMENSKTCSPEQGSGKANRRRSGRRRIVPKKGSLLPRIPQRVSADMTNHGTVVELYRRENTSLHFNPGIFKDESSESG